MSRRTITIDRENEQNLNQLRGRLLTEKNRDLDFTSGINMVLALGFNRLAGQLTEKELEIANKYIFDYALKIEALDDERWNTWMEHEYPRMLKRLHRLENKKSIGNSVQGKKKVDVPELEQSPNTQSS